MTEGLDCHGFPSGSLAMTETTLQKNEIATPPFGRLAMTKGLRLPIPIFEGWQ